MDKNKKTALDKFIKKFKEIITDYKEDKRLVDLLKELEKTARAFKGMEDPRGIQTLFKTRQQDRGFNVRNVSNEQIIVLKKFFDNLEISALINTNDHNIRERLAYARRNDDRVKVKGKWQDKTKFSSDPGKAYMESLEILHTMATNEGIDKDEHRLRAASYVLQYAGPQVMTLFEEKREFIKALIKFYISTLIPVANKRIREAVRQITGRADTDPVNLIIIFRELLPSVLELKSRAEKVVLLEQEAEEELKALGESGVLG